MVGYSTRRFTGMKRTASVAKTSRSSASSQKRSKRTHSGTMYVMCIYNRHHPVTLQLRKVYRAMRDAEGEKHGYIRVFDEDGDGLYPKRHCIEVALPRALTRTARKALV